MTIRTQKKVVSDREKELKKKYPKASARDIWMVARGYGSESELLK